MSRFDPFRDFPPSPPEIDWQARALAAEAKAASLTEALVAVDSEVLLTGNLKDIVDAALNGDGHG